MAGEERHKEMQALVTPNITERDINSEKTENTNQETQTANSDKLVGIKLRDQERPAYKLIFYRAQYGDEGVIGYLNETFLSQKCVIDDTCVILDNQIGIINIDNSSKCFARGRQYCIVEEVGRGYFGVVQKCIDTKSRQEFVMKTITISKDNECKVMASIRREVNTLLLCESDYIIKLIGIHIPNSTEFKLYLEYGGITMEQCFTEKNKINPSTLLAIGLQMLEGCSYLHQRDYVHTDLHMKNVLIKEIQGSLQVRLCDLGSVKRVQESLFTQSHGHTPDYFPPTVLNHLRNDLEINVSPRLDTFAIGKLLLEGAIGNHITCDDMSPFIDDEKEWKSAVSKTFLKATFKKFGNPPSIEYIKIKTLVEKLMSFHTTIDAAEAISNINNSQNSAMNLVS